MRKRLLPVLLLLVGLAYVQPVQAEDPPAVPAAATATEAPDISAIDTDGDGKVSAEEAKAFKDKEATAGDVVKEVSEVVSAVEGLKGKSGTGLALAISMLLAVIFKMLLSLVKISAKSTSWFAGKKGKAALKYTTLALGGLAGIGAGIAAALGAGMGWMDVLIIGLSGPGAMVVHELSSLLPGVGKHASVPDPDAQA